LQNAWAGRSERISVRIADLEFEREIEELRAVLVANRNHPDFAHMKYIEILSYTYDSRYIPYILKFKDSENEEVKTSVEEALVELRYEG